MASSIALSSSFVSLRNNLKEASSSVSRAQRLPIIRAEAGPVQSVSSSVSKRSLVATLISLGAITFSPLPSLALLDADEDELLLERVKRDRKSKILKRESLGSYKNEEASLQKAIFKLSYTGQAIDESDFARASVLLGSGPEGLWVAELGDAVKKVTSSAEEQEAANTLTTSIGALQSAVLKDDVDGAKGAFVTAADALELFAKLTGLAPELRGL
eukprot:TRINITY_DN37009_c0_g1_i1.p1 TRINITY_DN37009_c0_g1~~TRINITY_DN37009_c0_g1_i1.p1  ORF type:complete len:215 (-),score=39.64 TRINITY_DN37009_c0_g1_i1:460-1104(-)